MPPRNEARGRVLSRRTLVQTASLLALPAHSNAQDPAVALAGRWLLVDDEARRLVLAWQRLETILFEHHNWPKLTRVQQRQLPEAAPLFDMDDRLNVLHEQRQDLLPEIQASQASTRAGALAKLEVLAGILDLTDHPDAHALLRSALFDINRLWQ